MAPKMTPIISAPRNHQSFANGMMPSGAGENPVFVKAIAEK